jgi:beta-lactamase superfamily II metal-dependent hydrolase
MVQVEVFPALKGDCFLIHTNEGLILVDCGYASTYNDYLKERLEELHEKGQFILRFIITHIDEDHIQGALTFLKENGKANEPKVIRIEQIWYNSYRHLSPERLNEKISAESEDLLKSTLSINKETEEKKISAEQGSSIGAMILKGEYNWNSDFGGNAVSIDHLVSVKISDSLEFKLLSPDNKGLAKLEKFWKKELYKLGFRDKITNEPIFDDAFEFMLLMEKALLKKQGLKTVSASNLDVIKLMKCEPDEDDAVKNGSSIAFVLIVETKTLLFLGDAQPTRYVKSLQDTFPNEGQINFDFIKLSHHGCFDNNTPAFFKLTDAKKYCISTSGAKFSHPDPATLAWIIGRAKEETREIYFNYKNAGFEYLEDSDLQKKHKYQITLADKDNRTITIS